MDMHAPWRALDADDSSGKVAAAGSPPPEIRRLALAVAGIAAVIVAIAVIVGVQLSGPAASIIVTGSDPTSAGSAVPQPATIVVQVAGAVAHPGVYALPAGSRVADAIRAAGGYSPDVDPRLAEATLNLAAHLDDGQVVAVPRRGMAQGSATASGAERGSARPASAAGIVNLNTATAQELDTLPGVGPATAAKIIDARAKQPFRSVDELVTRKIVSAGTLGKFRDRVTV